MTIPLMTMPAQAAAPPVGRGFMTGYALAQVGGFIAFVPMLNILLPLKAEAIDAAGKAVLLSQVALWGALAAGLANIAAGWLSDATASRFGRRRPWIVIGALAVAAAHLLVFQAQTPGELMTGIILFQVAVNLMFGPLNAVLPDRVPDAQKGFVAALMGLGLPGASLFAAVVIALVLTEPGPRFLATGAAVVLLILPFALTFRERPDKGPSGRAALKVPALATLTDRDFLLAFLSRMLVQVTITLNVLYLLFFLQQTDVATRFPDTRPEAVLGWLIGAATVASLIFGFLGGLLSDRMGRRKGFVAAGGLMMAVGAGVMVVVPQWPGPLVAQVIFGAGLGLYSTVDTALVAQILPVRENAGRDLGVMNLAVTLPQIAAPILGIAVIAAGGGALRGVFVTAALFAVAGAMAVVLIRRVD